MVELDKELTKSEGTDDILEPRKKKQTKYDADNERINNSKYSKRLPNNTSVAVVNESSSTYSTLQNSKSVESALSSSDATVRSGIAIQLPSYLTNVVQDSYQFEPLDLCSNLANQYKSASDALQNFSTTRSFMENNSSKYMNHNNNNTSKYYEDKYFPISDFTSPLLSNKLSVSTSNYQQFVSPHLLPSHFNTAQNHLAASKSPLPSSAFQQFTAFHPLVTSTYATLGSNTYSSSFNASYFNVKLGVSDAPNNTYMYQPNIFTANNKLSVYPNTQGSTHIYPPYANNSLFPSNTQVLGSSLPQQQSVTTNSLFNAETLLPVVVSSAPQSQSAESVPVSPFSPTIPVIGVENGAAQTTPSFDTRLHFENDSSYNNVYCGTNIASSFTDNNEKFARRRKVPTGTKKSLKSKKNLNSDPEHNLDRIFIWDLEETIIIFHSLITGEYATKFGKDIQSTVSLGQQIVELVYHLANTHMFFNEVEDCDQSHIDDVSADDNGQDLSDYSFDTDGFVSGTSNNLMQFPGGRRGVDWMRKLAYRYRRIKELYSLYRNNLEEILGLSKRDQWIPLQMELEQLSGSWHTLAQKSLNVVHRRSNAMNILVSKAHLVQTLSKCMLYGLGSFFPIENIYSAGKVGKESCFQRIQSRFGRKCTYVVVGNGSEDENASKQLGIPFWRISNHRDLVNLQHALDLHHL